jgi:hypothetical protein
MEAVIAGIVAKIYDDLSDNQLASGWIMEALKGSQWICLTMLAWNDFNFAVLFYIINALNAWNNPDAWNGPYEFSLLIVYPFLILYNIRHYQSVRWVDFFFTICFIAVMALEPIFIQEEVGVLKWLFRSGACFNATMASYFGAEFGVSESMLKISRYTVGYAFVSSLFQVAMLTSSGTFSLPNYDLP